MEQLLAGASAPTQTALPQFINTILEHISPKLDKLIEKLENRNANENITDDEIHEKNIELYSLCKDQILKCACLMADIFKREIENSCILEDSRSWVLNRMVLCLDKLDQIEDNAFADQCVDPPNAKLTKSVMDLNLFVNDEFISWVDDSLNLLDIIEKLFVDDIDYIRDHAKNTLKRNQWVKECSSGLSGLHKIIRELIFSAMNICTNSLSVDQRIINARCHVILRESKCLMMEIVLDSKLIINDCDESECSNIQIKENLHFPTVRMFINILKDAIHTLEACINRAVLGLVLKCLTDPIKPLNKIVHASAECIEVSLQADKNALELLDSEIVDKSISVKDFDMHSEQLTQIGLFAVSCSADKQRVLQLKSCLASLEILDAHLIPTILSNPDSLHAQFLIDHWMQEIDVLRNCVFLIVDPVAFIDLVVELFQEKINSIKSESPLKWSSAQPLIGLGKCVLDYFKAYFDNESQVFNQNENLKIIIENVKTVVRECKVVGDLFLMKPNGPIVKNKVQEIEKPTKERKYQEYRVIKRLKLLYSLITKIVKELVNETIEDDEASILNSPQQSYTLDIQRKKETDNYKVVSTSENKAKGIFKIFDKFKTSAKTTKANKALPKVPSNNVENMYTGNVTFSRTTIVRSTYKKPSNVVDNQNSCSVTLEPIMARLKRAGNETRNIVLKDFISASGILDGINDNFLLSNISKENESKSTDIWMNESPKIRSSVFYNNSKGLRGRQSSLRRRVLINQMNGSGKKNIEVVTKSLNFSINKSTQDRSIESLNQSLDLHITDILEQLTKLSDTMSLLKIDCCDETVTGQSKTTPVDSNDDQLECPKNVLTLKINNSNFVSPKKVWNIKVPHVNKDVDDDDNVSENVKNIRAMSDKENVEAMTPKQADRSSKSKNLENVDCEIDVSFGSEISTPERLNDLHQLELKLANLKDFWKK
ncbi:uncharacterized protein LOC143916760 [Arctopsyche grandis]|uniref:uncharacterized protein LOC143916760 n=1 Tax=Arctopsyche grandis TaxID=121162 RepID=UPI00406D6F5D